MNNMNAPYAALWPRGPRQAKVKPLAKRLDTLEGKTVAWVWDYVFRGNEVFEQLEISLRERYPGVKFLHWDLVNCIERETRKKQSCVNPIRLAWFLFPIG